MLPLGSTPCARHGAAPRPPLAVAARGQGRFDAGRDDRLLGPRRIGLLLAVVMVIGLTMSGASGAVAATLKVQIENLRSSKGDVYLALWDRSESFTDGDLVLAGAKIPAARDRFLKFTDLTPGRYALVAYHDENGNGEFDQTWIGLPAEGLGFSNGAWIGFGPPSFDEAAVTLDVSERTIVIFLRY